MTGPEASPSGAHAVPAGEDKVLAGICGAVARSQGWSPGAVRVGLVALVLALGVAKLYQAGAILIILYAVGWFIRSQASGGAAHASALQAAPPPTATDRAPAPAEAAPARESAATEEQTAERPHLKELVHYLWSAETTPKPLYTMWAHGFALDGLPIPNEPGKGIGTGYTMRMPYGRVFVWAGWLVFLTESHNRPGEIPPVSRYWSLVLDYWKEYRRFASLVRLSITAYSRLTKEQRERLRRGLGNPNSFIVPFESIDSVEQVRGRMLVPQIRIKAEGHEYVLAPNGGLEIGPSFWRLGMGYLATWHPQLQAPLHEAVGANQRKERE